MIEYTKMPKEKSLKVTVTISEIVEDKPKFVEYEIWELLDDEDD